MRKIKVAQIGAGHDHASAAITAKKLMPEIFDIAGF